MIVLLLSERSKKINLLTRSFKLKKKSLVFFTLLFPQSYLNNLESKIK